MKKIIELAEKYLDTASEHDYTELAIAIGNRKIQEQTPITEEWLKEHGFVVSNEIHSKRDKVYVKGEVTVVLDVDCICGIIGNADCIEINDVSISFHKDTYSNRGRITLTDLYDILELCNIQTD